MPIPKKPLKPSYGANKEINPQDFRKHLDMVRQINEMFAERDARLAALEAEPVCFAFGIGTTTGTGGVTPLKEFGGKLEVQGNNVAIRFNQQRADDLYVFGALWLDPAAPRFPIGATLAGKTRDVCVIRFYNDTGNTINASATVLSFMAWCIGFRA